MRTLLPSIILGPALLVTALSASNALRNTFLHPPNEAKPRGYWVWPHGNFDYSTIRQELEAFKAKGLGGVDIFDLGIRDRKDVIPPGPGFLSVEQIDGIAFALDEAQRLGLKLGLIVSSSWNAGGTWTPPELASMNLIAWQEQVTGPLHYDKVLPFPKVPDSFRKPYGTFPLHVPKDHQGHPLFHREVALLACPLDDQGRITDPSRVRRLNDEMDATGRLICDLPAGRWLILRTVLVNFGQQLWLPSDHSQGQTMDHLSQAATRHHFQTVINRLETRIGPLRDTALERLYLASYEANAEVNWTPGFIEAFTQQHGYRPEPFLPALFGVEVRDPPTTERFRYDYRHAISELFIHNLYREASRLCREHGLLLCSEAGGPGAPLHDVPTEDLKALGSVDVMRGEFWTDKADRFTPEGFEELQIVKSIASAAHIYGHRIVEMEAFTSHVNWQEGPSVFKPLADRAFCEGMTRVVYHTMSHNLPEAGRPGWTYQAGTHMNTHLTWWDLSDQLHTYLARCSALLMQGDFVADVAYYCGQAIPNFGKPKHTKPGLGYGYDYDAINTEVLLTATVDGNGRVTLPSGMSYALLVLPDNDDRMDLAVLQHLHKLLDAGATVLGSRPRRTYGLRNHPTQQAELLTLAKRIWGESATSSPYERPVGRGRIAVGIPESTLLQKLKVEPDFDVWPPQARVQVDYIHRRTSSEDIYFLRNIATNSVSFEALFRTTSRQPEAWDPSRGLMKHLACFQQTPNQTRVPITLDGHGSVFVVFTTTRKPARSIASVTLEEVSLFPQRSSDAPVFEAVRTAEEGIEFSATHPGQYIVTFSDNTTLAATITPTTTVPILAPWEVRFPHGWAVPVRQTFHTLHSWTDSTNAATQAFSGIARYARQFDLPDPLIRNQQQVTLNLGDVREIARVYLNGNEIGISSFAPHHLDVTDSIRIGENSLVIEVANTWINQLKLDDPLPPDQERTHTNLRGPIGGQSWRDTEAPPSGLLGPVTLQFRPTAILQAREAHP